MIPVADQDLADVLLDDDGARFTLDECQACRGTGEGATCEATCWVCRGSGVVRAALPASDPEDEEEDAEEVAHG